MLYPAELPRRGNHFRTPHKRDILALNGLRSESDTAKIIKRQRF